MNEFDVIIIGAGPAGLLAAGRAAENGNKVLILEKMPQAGKKLLITGKGRCNITNNAVISEFIKHVYPNGKFLRNSFSKYFSEDIIELLKNYGVESTLERGERYFPESNKASDVLDAFLKWNKELGVTIYCNYKAEKLLVEDNKIIGIKTNKEEFKANNIIIATGGKSYPATGSTGDGYELARQVGHNIERVRPALVPLETEGGIVKKIQGLNLRNVKAVVWVNGKKAGEDFGEMIFTHFGLSGPIILTLSRIVVDELHNKNKVEISIDLKPALDEQKLDNRLQRDIDEHGKKTLFNIFKFWLPSSMIPVFIEQLGIDKNKPANQISGKERKKIRHLLKNFTFKISHNRSFKEAIITAGGIPTKEIYPKTMESKIISGLYFAGEIIDLDAETGGYNLQIAYSSGWLAGDSCNKENATQNK